MQVNPHFSTSCIARSRSRSRSRSRTIYFSSHAKWSRSRSRTIYFSSHAEWLRLYLEKNALREALHACELPPCTNTHLHAYIPKQTQACRHRVSNASLTLMMNTSHTHACTCMYTCTNHHSFLLGFRRRPLALAVTHTRASPRTCAA